ncbi:hypothetical protein B0H13DRAFT_1928908 [Mycena leptocephala]|nr:hypothetical protein B0H13DRAFT_1928908 [Mycena leptocephala]
MNVGMKGVHTKGGTYIHSNPRHIQLTGGTLSKCAAHERKGSTFHFGNVPGLAPTTLGKDMCPHPALFPLPPPTHYHLAPTSPPTRQKHIKIPTDGTNNSKQSTTDQLFIDRVSAPWSIAFHTYVFSYQIQNSASLPVAWPFEIADLNCKHSQGDATLNLEGTILFGDAGPGRERSTGRGTCSKQGSENRNMPIAIVAKYPITRINSQ